MKKAYLTKDIAVVFKSISFLKDNYLSEFISYLPNDSITHVLTTTVIHVVSNMCFPIIMV